MANFPGRPSRAPAPAPPSPFAPSAPDPRPPPPSSAPNPGFNAPFAYRPGVPQFRPSAQAPQYPPSAPPTARAPPSGPPPVYGYSNPAPPRANAPPMASPFSGPQFPTGPPPPPATTGFPPAPPQFSNSGFPAAAFPPPPPATTGFPPGPPQFSNSGFPAAAFPPPPPATTGFPPAPPQFSNSGFPAAAFPPPPQTAHSHYGPPVGGAAQSLAEDFQSLSVGSAPGLGDGGIDPKSLPRPLEGEEDEVPRCGMETHPLNCHPRFFRMTTHAVPSSQSLNARWHLPLGVVVHPLAETPDGEEVPVVNFGPVGIIRCRRCRLYINPFVTFTDAGRKWRCNLCGLLNDVPGEYFCSLDASGRRLDLEQRPELSMGSVEFVAPTEYMVRPPMPPLYFFLIDVSVTAVQSGLLEVIARTIKSCLNDLLGFPRTQIGFLTFDSTLHFYNLKSSLAQPQMVVVTDLDDIFLPLPDDLLVNLSESRHVVDAFLDSLPSMFQDNTNVESAFGPALRAALMVMSQLGGKLLVFQSTLPSLGVGRLRLRGDDLRVYGTDKEHLLRIPEDSFYKQMAAEFTKNQIAVDIFALSDKYSDIASLGSLAKYTGGQVYHFPSFNAAAHQDKLQYELARDLTRETAWEAVMRIRCGKGVRFTTYHGHFMLRSTDLLALPAVDCDKAFAMQFSLEETLTTTQTVYFQVALLYTSSSGERRIRVLTAAAPVVTDLGEMYRRADSGAIVSLLSRLAIENSLSHKLEDARQFVQLKLVKSLKEYRNLYLVQHRLGGRMIFPESLKFLALYVLSLCKSVALRGGYVDASLDERCAAGYNMNILPTGRILKYLYPNLLRVDEDLVKAKDDFGASSRWLALSITSLDPRGLCIYDDGFSFTIWFGGMLPSNIINSILGSDLSNIPDLSRVKLYEHDNEVSRKLMRIIKRLRTKNQSLYQLCQLVRQGEQPREGALLLTRLVEDQVAGTSSYIDWMLQISRQSQGS